jgi:hypothetical protein
MHPAVFLRLALHIEGIGNQDKATRDNENEGIVYLSVANPFLGRKSKLY